MDTRTSFVSVNIDAIVGAANRAEEWVYKKRAQEKEDTIAQLTEPRKVLWWTLRRTREEAIEVIKGNWELRDYLYSYEGLLNRSRLLIQACNTAEGSQAILSLEDAALVRRFSEV